MKLPCLCCLLRSSQHATPFNDRLSDSLAARDLIFRTTCNILYPGEEKHHSTRVNYRRRKILVHITYLVEGGKKIVGK